MIGYHTSSLKGRSRRATTKCNCHIFQRFHFCFDRFNRTRHFFFFEEKNQTCYDLSLVSIGPYHHGKPELRDMEMLKVTFTSKFVDDSGLSIQYLYGKVAEVATDPRRYYTKDSTDEFDDEKFTQIMFLDGCFILQFISCFLHRPEDLNMPGYWI
ncbi:hypothetical protein OIU76_021410 [Salix suchowensis]|nr:hypothetical protein OIU76_021410 [Salix suchowensis]